MAASTDVRSWLHRPKSVSADTARPARRLSVEGVALSLAWLSFVLYLLSSFSVRRVVSELWRLAEAFLF